MWWLPLRTITIATSPGELKSQFQQLLQMLQKKPYISLVKGMVIQNALLSVYPNLAATVVRPFKHSEFAAVTECGWALRTLPAYAVWYPTHLPGPTHKVPLQIAE